MKPAHMSNDDFVRKYEAYEHENLDNFVTRHSSTPNELRATIDYLIRHREMRRDVELGKLEAEARDLAEKLKDTYQKKVLVEIQAFKEVLALQEKLFEKDDEPRD